MSRKKAEQVTIANVIDYDKLQQDNFIEHHFEHLKDHIEIINNSIRHALIHSTIIEKVFEAQRQKSPEN